MAITYIVVLVMALLGLKRRREIEPWLHPAACDSIKGVFIVLVFISHSLGYTLNGEYELTILDRMALVIRGCLGQIIVVMFLFFSGYGVAESIKSKGRIYIRQFPRKRILSTLLNFDIAVAAYCVLALILGNQVISFRRIVASLICWDSLGNSNWYIFAILLCYVITWLVTILCKDRNKRFGFQLVLGVICLWVVMAFFRPNWWYNTLMAYPLGALASLHKDKVLYLLEHKFWLAFSLTVSLFCIVYVFRHKDVGAIMHNLMAMAFAASVAIFMFRMKIESKSLAWCGRHLFVIYIYQRLPMIILDHFCQSPLCAQWPLAFAMTSLLLTIGIAYIVPTIKV